MDGEIDYGRLFHTLGSHLPILRGIDLLRYGRNGFTSNVYILEGGRTLVDPCGPLNLAEELQEHYHQTPVERVIFTHLRPGCFDALEKVLDLWRPQVIVHQAELESGATGELEDHLEGMGVSLWKLRGNEEIQLSDRTLRVLYTPGYTPGSVSLYDPDSAVLFSEGTVLPIIDPDHLPQAQGSHSGRENLEELTESLRVLLQLEIRALLPSHTFPIWRDVKACMTSCYLNIQVHLQESNDLALINTGILLADLGDMDGALELFNKVLETDPGHPGACFAKGLACYQLGRFEEAIGLFDSALDRVPHFQEAQQARRMAAISMSGRDE